MKMVWWLWVQFLVQMTTHGGICVCQWDSSTSNYYHCRELEGGVWAQTTKNQALARHPMSHKCWHSTTKKTLESHQTLPHRGWGLGTRLVKYVVASLVSRYEKAHPCEKWKIVVYFCGLWLMSYGWRKRKKERKKGGQNDIFVVESLDCMKGLANFEGSFAIHKWSWFVWIALAGPFMHTPIPSVQAAILNLLNPYYMELLSHSMIHTCT